MIGREGDHELGLGERGGAEHHAVRARLERGRDGIGVAQSTADLDGHIRLPDDSAHVLEVPGLAGPRAIEVHDVKCPRPLLEPTARGVERVVVVGRLTPVVALHQADGATIADVDRGIEDHAGTEAQISAKLARTRRPAALDFSGWNCTP